MPARKWTREDLPEALNQALELALQRNARAPVVLRVTDLTGFTDWVLIVSARSDRQVAGIADGITRGLRGEGKRRLGADGLEHHLWDLLDYDDFMIHVFYHPVRMHYDLESMWSDAPRVELGLPADVMDTSGFDTLDAPSVLPEFRGDFAFGGYADEFDDDDEPAPPQARDGSADEGA